jgi:3-methyladenine DNA glycosylase/8-oxoguanine DNA glycosylase
VTLRSQSPSRITESVKVTDRKGGPAVGLAVPRSKHSTHNELHLAVAAPFHLEATVRVLQRRAVNRVDRWVDDRYVRVLRTGRSHVVITVENRGTIDAPDLRCYMHRELRSNARTAIERTVRRILGLNQEPQNLQRAARQQSAFRNIALALRGMRPPRFPSLFEAFARVVPFQQLSLDAGVSIVARLVERFGLEFEHNDEKYFSFPEASVIAQARIDSLRRCGLSVRKGQVLRDLARIIAAGQLKESELESMTTQEALRLLTELPGIGVWSASVVLLRGLGRLDVFPPGDVGAARGLRTVMGLKSDADIDAVVERFGDYRGYLYFHVLGGNLLKKGLIHPAPPLRPSPR